MAYLKLTEEQLRVMESKELVSSSFMYPNEQVLALINEVREARRQRDLVCTILKREFPLMSSRRLPFLKAEMIVRILDGELNQCEGLVANVQAYVKWIESNYDPKLDPALKYE